MRIHLPEEELSPRAAECLAGSADEDSWGSLSQGYDSYAQKVCALGPTLDDKRAASSSDVSSQHPLRSVDRRATFRLRPCFCREIESCVL